MVFSIYKNYPFSEGYDRPFLTIWKSVLHLLICRLIGRMLTSYLGDRGSIPGQIKPKTIKFGIRSRARTGQLGVRIK